MIAEINEDEILGIQKKVFQRTVFEIIFVLVIFIGIISYFVGRQLDKIFVAKKSKKRL